MGSAACFWNARLPIHTARPAHLPAHTHGSRELVCPVRSVQSPCRERAWGEKIFLGGAFVMPRHGSGINTGEHQIYMSRFVGERAAQLSDELRILHDWIIRPGGYQGQGCLSWLKPRFKQMP